MAKIIDEAELSESLVNGYTQLNALSQGDYGRGVAEVFDDLEASQNDKLLRLGRLMGVALKQPYSEPSQMDPSLSRTGAIRGWNLLDDMIDVPQAMPTWQFQAMEGLSLEFGFGSQTTFAQIAKHETGFLKYMGNSFRKYLCGDPEMAKKIEKAVENLKNLGGIKHLLTPQGLIGTGASSLAALLIAAVPWLTVASGPILVALMVILGTIGLDAFCQWTGTIDNLSVDDEK